MGCDNCIFAADLAKELAAIINFEFEIVPVPDGKHGNKLPNGSWNGMVKELIDRVRSGMDCVWS